MFGGMKMPHGLREMAAPYRLIGDLLSKIAATDAVSRGERIRLYEAVEALAALNAPDADFALAWRATRAVHAFEFAMVHSAAPDRIYARKALKRALAAWTKQIPALRAAWDERPHVLAA
jgi:hypothetical protein